MKKFFFKLESVLKYKNDNLNILRNEHAKILQRLASQEEKIAGLEKSRDAFAAEFDKKKMGGIASMEAVNYQNYLTRQSVVIKREYDVLRAIHQEEEQKKNEILEMRKESVAIEKLKEINLEQYRKEESKEHEQFIEEFVSNSKVAERSR